MPDQQQARTFPETKRTKHLRPKPQNKKMSSQDIQVANWEKHLAGIIEQTNKNISFLNKSVKPIGNATTTNQENNSVPPPPPLPNNSRRSSTSPFPPPFPPNHPVQNGMGYYEQQAQQVLNGNHSSRRASVSRPLQKNVEDDLTKRISQSVKRTVERTIVEKTNAAQTRVDRLNDQLESLNEDNVKMHKHCSNLSRSMASQDRLGKRLKDEWEKQRAVLKKLEDAMLKDMGWKEATAIDLKIMRDQQTQDTSLRVTANELRSALETITAKTMVAVDRATISSKQSFDSELGFLKQEMKSLKEENQVLRHELQSCTETSSRFMSKFDEGHVKDILSNAVRTHLNVVEAKISSSTRSAVREDINACEVRINLGVVEKLKDCLGREVLQDGGDIHRVFASIVETMLDRQQKEMAQNLSSSILLAICENQGEAGCRWNDHVNTLISSQVNECRKQIMNGVAKDIAKANADANKLKEIIETTLNQAIIDTVRTKDSTSSDEFKKNIDSMAVRLEGVERWKDEIPVPVLSAQNNTHTGSRQDDSDQGGLKNDIGLALTDLQALSDNCVKNEEQVNNLNADMCNLYGAMDAKLKRNLEECQLKIDYKMQPLENRVVEVNDKIECIQRAHDEIRATIKSIISHGKRIEDLESTVRNDRNISEEEKKPELDMIADTRLDKISQQSEVLKEEMKRQIEKNRGEMLRKMKEVEDSISQLRIGIEHQIDSLQKESVGSQSKIQGQYRDLLSLESAVGEMKTSTDKRTSSFTDIASCFGKVSALDGKVGVEMASLRSEFVSLQDNVIDMNATSMERISTLVSREKGATVEPQGPEDSKSLEIEHICTIDAKISHVIVDMVSHACQLDSLGTQTKELHMKVEAQNQQINEILTTTSCLEKTLAAQNDNLEVCHKTNDRSSTAAQLLNNEYVELTASEVNTSIQNGNENESKSTLSISPMTYEDNLKESRASLMSDTQVESSPKIPTPPYLCSETFEGSIGDCDEIRSINESSDDNCKEEVLEVKVNSETLSEMDFSEESISSFEEESVSTFEDDTVLDSTKQSSIESVSHSYGSSFASEGG